MPRIKLMLALGTLALGAAACSAGAADDDTASAGDEALTSSNVTKSFVAKGTGYFPDNSAMEGGFVDRKGAKLKTLQQYLAGQADYVSVAMDPNAFSYGQRLRIAELNKKYGKDIVFKVVDTGGAFKGKGTSRIDICTASSKASVDPTINGTLHIDAIAANAPSVPVTPTLDAGVDDGDDDDDSSDYAADAGAACSSDGMCNPGNDGSGLICVSRQCVPGCHSNAQCPGATSCSSGQCR